MSASRSISAIFAACVLLAAQGQPASAAHANFVWGVNGHPFVSYPGVSMETQLDTIRDLGLTSYRVDVPDRSAGRALKYLVGEAKSRGITVLPVITPAYDLDKETPESLEKKAYDLAFAVVSDLKGQIQVWELGNELENYAIIRACETRDDGTKYPCTMGLAGGVSPLDYFGPRWAKVSAVLKGLTRGALAADPSIRRAVGTAGWGHIGAFERMKADGISWEISVWHMYGEDPEWAFKKLAEYRHPIWVTEFNNPNGSRKGEEEQAKGLEHAMSRLAELRSAYDVEEAHIYELMDEPQWGEDYEAHMGLVGMRKDEQGHWGPGDRKAAYAAVAQYLERTGARPPRDVVRARQCVMTPSASAQTVAAAQSAIHDAYCLVLGRDADGAGAASWLSRLAAGMPAEELVIDLLNSDEFAFIYQVPKLSATEYVTLVHRLLLNTDPPKAMVAKFVADLQAKKSPADFQRALTASKEFRALHPVLFAKLAPIAPTAVVAAREVPHSKPEVRRNCDLGVLGLPLQFERGQILYSYCLVLGRWPDGYGLSTWIGQMRAGLTLEQFLSGLLESPEFANKYQVEALDNADFVTLLYRLLLGREPDGDSLDAYVTKLSVGLLSRGELGEAMLASDEFRAKQAALFTALKPARERADLSKVQQ